MTRARLLLLIGSAAMLALATSGTAQAAITVSNQNDSGPGSLRQAVAEAPPGATIVLPAGTYNLTSGPLLIKEKSVTIAGHGSADTVIRAGGAFGVIEILGPLDATFEGVTIRDGNIVGAGAVGGGIWSISADLTLRNSVVTNNSVNANGAPGSPGGTAEGAGVFVVAGLLTLVDSTVSNNTATAVGGSEKQGGIAEGVGVFSIGEIEMRNSTISDNRADSRGGQGPSVATQNGGPGEGVGLFFVQTGATSSNIVGSTISGNVVETSAGPGGKVGLVEGAGAFAVTAPGSMTVLNSTIAANVGRGEGPAGPAALGGGLFAVGGKPGTLALLNTTISGNRLDLPTATREGGNLFAVEAVIRNSIIANGAAAPGSENCKVTSVTSLGFNLDSLNQCGFTAPGDQVNKDPLLGPLQNNGGPTQTLLPAANSPVVDQGAGAGVDDQRGVVRPSTSPRSPTRRPRGPTAPTSAPSSCNPRTPSSSANSRKTRKKARRP